ncbi:HNH endonuclease signature motif containing protein [Sulfitobacter sp. G21635-S1]|uniref:HNH endonuclease signature motif containing protein n=1 Tax=Sulfitobacter sp. G21635-S1 TaxID=3014043 RepID=UPI0022AED233|nr:HNH endonuclease signature motif containing protein [Sulfitobacter sp. G21635-S1]MCZ4259187.1 HNH endonuclease signature motif containing protein [Sulfitobacter sp. G21635-S1]
MKGRRLIYTPEELAWIKARCRDDRKATHSAFCALFGRVDVSLSNLNSLCKRNGWLTGRTGRFDPGQVPPNKGKKMPFNENRAKTQFKKGQVSHTFRGAGHERVDNKDGYIVMIVEETNPWTGARTRPVHKHRWLWEQKNGPVPEGMVLKCRDGDKTNTDPSNWVAIPRAMLPRLNGRFGRGYDAAPAELKPVLMATAKLEHAARQKKRG